MSEVLVLDRIDTRLRNMEASLPPMAYALAAIDSKVEAIDHQVDSLVERQGETQRFLASFYEEFHGYLEDYRRRAELQLAETRIVKVRQELERRFGHHDEVRRRVTGILQATDVALVRAETVRTTAEELMLGAPRYWLAPGLVALMAWIVGERDLADRALAEALRRDPYKTNLFLTLICRRAGRPQAMSHWLGLYLRLLDPQAVDREVVVVLDAVATGTLGREAQDVFWQASLEWIEALRQIPGQVETQARRWLEVLEAERGRVEPEELKLLRVHSATWPALEAALAGVRRNRRVAERFQRVVATPTLLPSSDPFRHRWPARRPGPPLRRRGATAAQAGAAVAAHPRRRGEPADRRGEDGGGGGGAGGEGLLRGPPHRHPHVPRAGRSLARRAAVRGGVLPGLDPHRSPGSWSAGTANRSPARSSSRWEIGRERAGTVTTAGARREPPLLVRAPARRRNRRRSSFPPMPGWRPPRGCSSPPWPWPGRCRGFSLWSSWASAVCSSSSENGARGSGGKSSRRSWTAKWEKLSRCWKQSSPSSQATGGPGPWLTPPPSTSTSSCAPSRRPTLFYQGAPEEPAALPEDSAGAGTNRQGDGVLAVRLAAWDLVPPPCVVQGAVPALP